ncbi:Hypothetical protein FKW44_017531 [Caligus rogercresseyi]|uniref:Uncharacterized protein n=1 Tax=Caligus rogercresseyi TaxID=217165 RepID=A0A7T8GTK6_CALRO|nr:Hypothetical protein FKW44_017531 [Caligus rogercresseyi]
MQDYETLGLGTVAASVSNTVTATGGSEEPGPSTSWAANATQENGNTVVTTHHSQRPLVPPPKYPTDRGYMTKTSLPI